MNNCALSKKMPVGFPSSSTMISPPSTVVGSFPHSSSTRFETQTACISTLNKIIGLPWRTGSASRSCFAWSSQHEIRDMYSMEPTYVGKPPDQPGHLFWSHPTPSIHVVSSIVVPSACFFRTYSRTLRTTSSTPSAPSRLRARLQPYSII